MNAVINKPRAKVAKASAPLKPTLSILRNTLKEVEEKVAAVYEMAEPGSTMETLLEHIEGRMRAALQPIYREDLSAEVFDASYAALFLPLALLEGAIAVSRGSVLEHTLCEAHAQLDWAHTQMDSACEIARTLPSADPAADFIRGRDNAINMLAEAEALMDEREGLRWMRGGKAQDNLVKGYLTDLIEDPSLIPGFTSILSMTIRNDQIDLDCLRQITLAETQAGEIGADGTKAGESEQSVASSPAKVPTLIDISAAFDGVCEGQNVMAVLQAAIANEGGNDDAYFGIQTLARLALGSAMTDPPTWVSLCETASLYAQAIALCDRVNNDANDDELLHAACSLMNLAKAHFDTAMQQLPGASA